MLLNGYRSFNAVDLGKPLNDVNLALHGEKGVESSDFLLLTIILAGILIGIFV